jgi:hypothetical protein
MGSLVVESIPIGRRDGDWLRPLLGAFDVEGRAGPRIELKLVWVSYLVLRKESDPSLFLD